MARAEFFARTEVGCVREKNEDAFLVCDLASGRVGLEVRAVDVTRGGLLVAVADGMGGAAAGDIASKMAVEQVRRVLQAASPFVDSTSAQSALLEALLAANRAILGFAHAHPEKRGMGTTLTAALLFGPELHVAHIGDSRAYVRRGRALTQITTDHSWVGQLVATGQLTPEQARAYEHRNVLMQALGVQQNIQPEIAIASLRAGDHVLLCSDGLTGPLTDAHVLDTMLKFEDPVRGCRALTEAACQRGGGDNVTVALLRVLGEDLPAPEYGRAQVQIVRATHALS
jgi:serine/threonine protein phosphatase PrpC